MHIVMQANSQIHHLGDDPGEVDWVACLSTLWQSLYEQAILLNKVYNETQPNSVACFILFMMVVEYWQLQDMP